MNAVMSKKNPGPLSPFRVLDLTNEKGLFCGKLLGDLGADVIQIEPPPGNSARNLGPFYNNIPHPEKSLYWYAYAQNKRSMTCNLASKDGRALFTRLVEQADVVVESFSPGYLKGLGLGYEDLCAINPRIILTSVTPFGQGGPYKDYKASDLVVWAMGGIMHVTGDPKRPPLRISFPQAYLHAGAYGASGTAVALYHRELTGEGQHVDVPAQQAVTWILMNARETWDLNKVLLPRSGSMRTRVGTHGLIRTQGTWKCKDWFIQFLLLGGPVGASTSMELVKWMESEGMHDDFLAAMDWPNFDLVQSTQETIDAVERPLADFFLKHTMAELYEGAVQRRMMLYPLSNSKAIVENAQLAARHFWIDVMHPELDRHITYPGPFMKASKTPGRILRRAPLIGEHNNELYQELGLSPHEMITLKSTGII